MKTAYLICPVRKLTDVERRWIGNKIIELRKDYDVYVPFEQPQDVDGKVICDRYAKKIKEVDIVFCWWNPDSEGSLFDFGMAYVLNKPVIVLNAIKRTEGKSYSNVLDDYRTREFYEN